MQLAWPYAPTTSMTNRTKSFLQKLRARVSGLRQNSHKTKTCSIPSSDTLPQAHVEHCLIRLLEIKESIYEQNNVQMGAIHADIFTDASPLWNAPHLVALCKELVL